MAIVIMVIVGVAITVPSALVLIKWIKRNWGEYQKNAKDLMSFEKKFKELLRRDNFISHTEVKSLGSQAKPAYEGVANGVFPLSDDVRSAIALYDAMPHLVQKHNKEYIASELARCSKFFDSCMGYPLDGQQRRACVIDDNAMLVIAGAGSGKTSTMAAKVAYLVRYKHVPPTEILLLSYTKEAAKEMGRRIRAIISKEIESLTFHKLGLELIKKFKCCKEYDIADEDVLLMTVHKFFTGVDSAVSARDYANVAEYFAYYFSPEVPSRGACPPSEYIRRMQAVNLKTLKAMAKKIDSHVTMQCERVKSVEELVIANYLFLNGINYEYERSYPKEYEHDENHRQYHPDFYLPDYEIYIEHYGLNANGEPPPFLSEGDKRNYVETLKWKRELHVRHQNKYVETFSYQMHDGTLFDSLKEKLQSLGVEFLPRDPHSVMKIISENMKKLVTDFETLVSTFITLFKSNGYTIEKFDELMPSKSGHGNERCRHFLGIAKTIFALYQQRLNETNSIDFNDMIIQATDLVVRCQHSLPWRYIIVDEYQDVSVSRARLLKAIVENTGAHLFCVGDDWQSIYRFAGSDISLFVDFGRMFGEHEETLIETTYRNSQEIIDVMGAFVQKNPMQKKKSLKSEKRFDSPVRVILYPTKDKMSLFGEALLRAIKEIDQMNKGHDSTVMLLGRNKRDELLLKLAKDDRGCQLLQSEGDGRYSCREMSSLSFRFLTVHTAKGLEADNVIVINCSNATLGFPNQIVDDPLLGLVLSKPEAFLYAEERRLFYVAVTRTKNATYLLVPEGQESAFVRELQHDHRISFLMMDDCMGQEMKRCPECGKEMVVRQRKRDGHQFWGCSNYPICRHVEDVSQEMIAAWVK